MNTGIQDAVNLGWKLAQVMRGRADPAVLDTYEQERAPVGRMVLRFTDWAFTIATSTNPLVRFGRTRLAPALLPLLFRSKAGRAAAFRTVSELGIRYRDSALSLDGPTAPRRGPRAGDRLPDGSVLHDGRLTSLHSVVAQVGWHLLLCGAANAWPPAEIALVGQRWSGLVSVHWISAADLHDASGKVLRRLGLGAGEAAHYLVRPDGHIGYRSSGTDLAGATSTVNLPPFRSAKTRLTVSIALPVETSTLMLNFLLKASTTGRYWRDGAPPEAMDSVPSCCAAVISLDHSCSKLAIAAAPNAVFTPKKKNKMDPNHRGTYPFAGLRRVFISSP